MEVQWMRCNQCNIEVVSAANVCPNHVGHVMVPTGKAVEEPDLPVAPPAQEPPAPTAEEPPAEPPVTTREVELEPGGTEPSEVNWKEGQDEAKIEVSTKETKEE
jgi:hypothetical protein